MQATLIWHLQEILKVCAVRTLQFKDLGLVVKIYFNIDLVQWWDRDFSHGNSYIFYEVDNSYEFIRPHSKDLVWFV